MISRKSYRMKVLIMANSINLKRLMINTMNAQRQKTWIASPTGSQTALMCLAILAGFTLLLLSMTNFFIESMTNRQALLLGAMAVPALGVFITVLVNYRRSQRERNLEL